MNSGEETNNYDYAVKFHVGLTVRQQFAGTTMSCSFVILAPTYEIGETFAL